MAKLISDKYTQWAKECEARFQKLKSNEEELNRIFIDIYGLQDELTPEVEDKDVTVRRADLQREIKSLLSYAVGCLFGRYSLDEKGLCYAGGEWDASKYKTIRPVKDNVLPICDDDYLESDLTGKIVEFVKIVYGEDTLEENLKFIADALGTKGATPREAIRNYLLNGFYADHCKIYQKRPIYWLVRSRKENTLKGSRSRRTPSRLWSICIAGRRPPSLPSEPIMSTSCRNATEHNFPCWATRWNTQHSPSV